MAIIPLTGDIDGDFDLNAADLALFIDVLLGRETDRLCMQRSDLTGYSAANRNDIQAFVAADLSL